VAIIGTGTKVLSTTAAALGALACHQVVVHNDDAAIAIKIGNASAQNYTVTAGGSSGPIAVTNINQVYVKSASGTPTCSYIAS
jgi:predicted RNA methylase